MKSTKITKKEVRHIAKLANLHVSKKIEEKLAKEFTDTLAYVNKIQSIDTSNVAATNQVSGLKNVFRQDQIDQSQRLSQKEALKNSPNTHNGYFVVKAVIK